MLKFTFLLISSFLFFSLPAFGGPLDHCRGLVDDSKLDYFENTISSDQNLSFSSRSYKSGGGDRQKYHYDIMYHPNESSKTPIVVFYHSGGFKQGDRCSAYNVFYDEIKWLLWKNAAFATVNYRFLNESGGGVLDSLKDGRQALQILKRRGRLDYNVDKHKFALVGKSAGGGIASWIAFGDDVQDTSSSTWWKRESSRVRCAMLLETQATYKITKWTDIFTGYNISNPGNLINTVPGFKEHVAEMYDRARYEDITSSHFSNYGNQVDMLGRLSSGDPRFYVQNVLEADQVQENTPNLYHHKAHAKALKDKAQTSAVGVTVWAYMGKGSHPTGEARANALYNTRKSFLRNSSCLDLD